MCVFTIINIKVTEEVKSGGQLHTREYNNDVTTADWTKKCGKKCGDWTYCLKTRKMQFTYTFSPSLHRNLL